MARLEPEAVAALIGRIAQLEERIARADAVADYWAQGAMERGDDPPVPYRTMAHPLACTLAALRGEETEPDQLGITREEFDRRVPEVLVRLWKEDEDLSRGATA